MKKTKAYINNLDKDIQKSFSQEKAAIFYGCLSVILTFFVNCFLKFSPVGSHWYLAVLLRGLGGFLLGHAILYASEMSTDVAGDGIFKALCLRNALVISALGFQMIIIRKIPLSEIMLITNCVPAFCFFWNYVINNKKMEKKDVMSAFSCFLGMFLILLPNIDSQNANPGNQYASGSDRIFYEVTLLFAVMLQGLGQVLTKSLNELSPVQITVNLNFYFLVFSSLFQVFNGVRYELNLFDVFLGLLVLTIGFQVSTTMYFHALMIGNPPRVSLSNYLGVILSFLMEVMLLGEIPQVYTMLGALFVILGMIINVYY